MSKEGLNKVAKLLSDIQSLRIELLKEPINKQDAYLSAMLAQMNTLAGEKIIEITTMKGEELENEWRS